MNETNLEGIFSDPEQLLALCVQRIVKDESEKAFIDWLAHWLHARVGADSDPGLPKALAFSLGRAIWNATPLPSNDFRPRPMPRPGRNDRCPCGSARKYKHCCERVPPLPNFESELIWLLLLEAVPASTLRRALESGRIPPAVLGEAARRTLAERGPAAVVRLIEPLFGEPLDSIDSRLGGALYVLCDAYMAQRKPRKKRALLERIARSNAAKPIRADAAQRLATIAMDASDRPAAWDWFRFAQRLNPDDFSLALLEVSLLLAQRSPDQARERAAFWLRRLAQRDDIPEDVLAQLEQLARDPQAVMANAELEARGVRASELTDWLASVRDRPLPACRAEAVEPIDLADQATARDRLRVMLLAQGIPENQIGRAVDRLMKDLEKEAGQKPQPAPQMALPFEPPASPARDAEPALSLSAPELSALEADWHRVFPDGKPFSTRFGLLDPGTAWGESQARWLSFLGKHPQAYDSLDILDDLATALEGDAASDWKDERVLEPILGRGAAIVLAAMSGKQGCMLPWADARNRAGLRLVVRFVQLLLRQQREQEARQWMEHMLAWNPHDNHGVRALLALSLGRSAEHQRVLDLADRYAGDIAPELAYGRCLALLALGRRDEAEAALAEAQKWNPHVPAMLLRGRVASPAQDGPGVLMGGREEAYLYWEGARETWAGTPGALEWLKKNAGRRQRGRPAASGDRSRR